MFWKIVLKIKHKMCWKVVWKSTRCDVHVEIWSYCFLFVLLLWDRNSLCSPNLSGHHYIDQADFKLRGFWLPLPPELFFIVMCQSPAPLSKFKQTQSTSSAPKSSIWCRKNSLNWTQMCGWKSSVDTQRDTEKQRN